MAEDRAMVEYIKDKFMLNYYTYSDPLTAQREIQTQPSSALMSGLMWNSVEPSASTMFPVKSEHSETVDSVKPRKRLLSTLDQFVPFIDFEDAHHASKLELSGSFRKESENQNGDLSGGLDEEAKSPGLSIDDYDLEVVESKLFELSRLEEELETCLQRSRCKLGVLGESYNGAMNFHPAGCLAAQSFENQVSSVIDYRNLSSSFTFSENCELQKALGSNLQSHEFLLDSLFSIDDAHGTGLINDTADTIESRWFSREDDEHLLEAVVANGFSGSDDNSSDISNSIKSSLTLGQTNASHMRHTEFKVGEEIPVNHVAMSIDDSPPASVSPENIIDPHTNREKHRKGCNTPQTKKGSKLSTVAKRRARPGENPKPRPRDRQLIQDRIKELRELVPNGVKVSCLLKVKYILTLVLSVICQNDMLNLCFVVISV